MPRVAVIPKPNSPVEVRDVPSPELETDSALLDVELSWKSAELDMKLSQLQTDAMEVLTKQGFNSEAALLLLRKT